MKPITCDNLQSCPVQSITGMKLKIKKRPTEREIVKQEKFGKNPIICTTVTSLILCTRKAVRMLATISRSQFFRRWRLCLGFLHALFGPMDSIRPHLNSDVGLDSGGRGILTELSLCYSIV